MIALGYPVLFAASRKTYLGRLLAGPDGEPRPVEGREAATIATSVLAAAAGAWGVRVHDVQATVDALAVWRATGSPRLSRSNPDRRTNPGAGASERTDPRQGAVGEKSRLRGTE